MSCRSLTFSRRLPAIRISCQNDQNPSSHRAGRKWRAEQDWNYGIFLLSGVGAFLLFVRPTGQAENASAIIYGVGLGLTFDEFGMWLHLGGPYWQRASFDAVIVIAALLGLFSFAPNFQKFKTTHWGTLAAIVVMLAVFGLLSAHAWGVAGEKIKEKIKNIEAESPP